MDDPAATVDEPSTGAAPPLVTLRVTGWSLMRAVLLVAVGLLALGVAIAASTVLWWLAIAAAVAGAFHPAVTWLRRWMPAWAAIITVILVVLAVLGLVGYRGAAELTAQFEVLRGNALAAAREIQSSTKFGQVAQEFGLVDKTISFFEHLPATIGGAGADDPAATVQSAASSGSALFAIATFAVLLLIFGSRFVRAGLEQIDDPRVRARVGELVVRSYKASSRYVWLMAARAVVMGVAGGLLCAALGLETPTALGVGIAALSLIPGLGIVLAAIPIGIYLAVGSPATGIILIVAALGAQALEATVVQRRIDDRSVHVGPTATLVAALVGLQLYGFGGALVGLATAVYTLAVLRNLAEHHDEVLTAMRRLVRDADTGESEALQAGRGSTVMAGAGSQVVVGAGSQVVVGEGAEVVPAGGGGEGHGSGDGASDGDRESSP